MRDFLPSPAEDHIIRLYNHHFLSTDLIFREFIAIHDKYKTHKSHIKFKIDGYLIFGQLWLSLLYVVGQGFESKIIKKQFSLISNDVDDLEMMVYFSSINHMWGQCGNSLRPFRNAAFHFQDNIDLTEKKILDFFKPINHRDPLNWAIDLHREMRKFFESYRVNMTLLRILNGGR